jgi:hypothetical protein
MVIKEKKELWGIKQMDKRYKLKQLPICSTQLLEYNHMRNNIKTICNVYLQHHPIKVNIWGCQISCIITSQFPLTITPN